VDEPAGRGLQSDGACRDRQVAELHLRLERAAGSDSNEGWVLRDREDLGDHDLDVVGPDARGDDRDR